MEHATRQPRNIEVVASYCLRRRWPIKYLTPHVLRIQRRTPESSSTCFAFALSGVFIFRSRYPFAVPRAKRQLVADFIARVNVRSPFPTLSLDHRDGEISVTTCMPAEEGSLDSARVDSVVEPNTRAFEQWFTGVVAACFTDMSPQAALALCGDLISLEDVIARANKQLDRDDHHDEDDLDADDLDEDDLDEDDLDVE